MFLTGGLDCLALCGPRWISWCCQIACREWSLCRGDHRYLHEKWQKFTIWDGTHQYICEMRHFTNVSVTACDSQDKTKNELMKMAKVYIHWISEMAHINMWNGTLLSQDETKNGRVALWYAASEGHNAVTHSFAIKTKFSFSCAKNFHLSCAQNFYIFFSGAIFPLEGEAQELFSAGGQKGEKYMNLRLTSIKRKAVD